MLLRRKLHVEYCVSVLNLLHDIGTAADVDTDAMICTNDDCEILRLQESSQRRHIFAHSHFVFNQTLSGSKRQKK